jgi:hypothetical protein
MQSALTIGLAIAAVALTAAPATATAGACPNGNLCLFSAPNLTGVQENVPTQRNLRASNVYTSYNNNTLRCAWFWDNANFTGLLWVAYPHEVENLLPSGVDNRVNSISFTSTC